VAVYDFVEDEYVIGNTNLTLTHINNYDIRWEWFPGPGDVLSAGGFYKELTDSIEKTEAEQVGQVTFVNRPDATLYGYELEARKNLGFIGDWLTGFSIGGNFTYVTGTVTVQSTLQPDGTGHEGFERDALFDQSEYIINADLSYDHVQSGFAFTVGYNVSSERLVLIGENSPDVYEQPAPSLDIVMSKRFGKYWKLKLSAKNLLNPKIEKIYGKDGDFPGYGPYSSYRKGITVGLSLNGEF
jgi:outer membrane receptor protein involved in Fe transport